MKKATKNTLNDLGFCYHCGQKSNENEKIEVDDKVFCCTGCLTVYSILTDCELGNYYDLNQRSGLSPIEREYDFLENSAIVEKLIDFRNDEIVKLSLYIPSIHCSSCLYLLENLYKIQPEVLYARVDFTNKRVTFQLVNSPKFGLQELAKLLGKIGYPPLIEHEIKENQSQPKSKELLLKIGVAGFCTGNIMLFSFPEYLGLFETKYIQLFNYLNLFLILPVIFYAGNAYFRSVYYAFKTRTNSIDFPILLGIMAVFLRSAYLVIFKQEAGYFDSVSGLIFFLLIGQWYQQKTYNYLSFDRKFQSFFPLSVIRINEDGRKEQAGLEELEVDNRIVLRQTDLIPADAMITKGVATIDYSFITGESQVIDKNEGQFVYAGGKLVTGNLELRITQKPKNSYLNKLWQDSVFEDGSKSQIQTFSSKVSAVFTPVLILTALAGSAFWYFESGIDAAFQVFTTILIIACPCALSLSYPFALGSGIRVFEKNGLFLKDIGVVERIAGSRLLIFDKTGTLTDSQKTKLEFTPFIDILPDQLAAIQHLVSLSKHPKAQLIASCLEHKEDIEITDFNEHLGYGLSGLCGNDQIRLGSYRFIHDQEPVNENEAETLVEINGKIAGYFSFTTVYRSQIARLFNALKANFELYLLSGDSPKDYPFLSEWFEKDHASFNQSPSDKLTFVKKLRGNSIMIGDGLNDAGALKAAHVGIAITENTLNFTPSSDAILKASSLDKLDTFIAYSQFSVKLIKMSFALSILYNLVGIFFGLTASLSPLVAAILMPINSVTIVAFSTFGMFIKAKRMNIWK